MKLLFAIKGLDQAAGGAERVISDVCSYLADKRGHDVFLLTFDRPGAAPFYPLSRKVRLIQLGIGDTRSPTSLPLLLRRIVALRKSVRSLAPDVVVAFMHSMFVPVALALAGSGIPLVASEHIVMDYYRTRRTQFVLFVAVVPFIRFITVLSDTVARRYPKWIRRKMIVVTNPISPVFQQAVTTSNGKDPHRILSIGRFSKRKDHSTLLAAFASISSELPDWSLRIIGDGVLRPALEDEVERLGLQDRVSLPGVVLDIPYEMTQASFFALASRYESFGLVFVEAMACERAAVAFADCQGANEVIEDGETGLLVEPQDSNRVAAMAEGLRYLMTNEVERRDMGKRGRARVFQHFSIDRVCGRWEEVLDDAALDQTIGN
jgi:glycosyltransferase involved in cell wall biosynthesis